MKSGSPIMCMLLIFLVLCAGCSGAGSQNADNENEVTLILGAYTTPREAYAEILPLFQEYWLAETGQFVKFERALVKSPSLERSSFEQKRKEESDLIFKKIKGTHSI